MPLPPSRASGPYRPTRLGQWEVIAKIAGGGMSAVYLGRNADAAPDETPMVVALKIARHDTSMDERLVKMFLDEGKLIARLVHPNIVQTLEVGTDSEQDFIAMELMLGKTFAAVHDTIAARGIRMNPEIAAWTAARVAEALHFAHDLTDETTGRTLNLVHRDVNPANIFATFKGEVKLFDFGLAKVTTGDTASSNQMLAGKLSYLSPEQVMQVPVDRRSDIFSLGTSLWEFLTGKRLFRRDSDIDTVRAVQLGPIPDIRTIAPDLPEDLARITKTALERNRDHRYPTAAHFARELNQWLYSRTSPSDVTSRLAQLVDTLFPGEQKKQSGWLKPAVTSGMGKANNFGQTMPSSGNPRPPGPEIRRDSRETTAVMHNAPIHTPKDGIPALSPSDSVAIAGPMTPRDGAPSVVPAATSVAPPTPRMGSMQPPNAPIPPSSGARSSWPVSQRTPSVAPPPRQRPPRVQLDTPPPVSRTEIGIPIAPDVPASEPPTDVGLSPLGVSAPVGSPFDIESTMIAPSPSFPPPPKNPSFAPPSNRAPRTITPLPAPAQKQTPSMAPPKNPAKPSFIPTPSASFAPPGMPGKPSVLPAKSSFIATPSASFAPPGMPTARPSVAPIPTPAAPFSPVKPSAAPIPTPATPFVAPKVAASGTAIGQARAKRAPIPLPSRVPLPSSRASVPPKGTPSVAPPPAAATPKRNDTDPPDSSKTQTDVQIPNPKR